MITVYTLPGCTDCTKTTRQLDRTGTAYQTRDLTDPTNHHEAMTACPAAKSAPIVVDETTGETWTGYRPDKLVELIT